ncbi:SAM-dependent methyltransferase [Actinoallomurus rhizosphaericola]|uniref:SAM-dependent methyltransferase n=1 Tax=Actinoallomurus rhizosphaericola TaxID=2952536 RepID=UPI0020937AFF|nr:SAM-dependent methyltransferase [Actinoallomurus rhizosphaericola]MCO5998150.1 SAM-dependent methyltransferase [Actinoallomurus rhizosphaericola]
MTPDPRGTGSHPGIDTSVPHTARMYDYLLGGKDNFAVDRAAVRKVLEAMPDMPQSIRLSRLFLRRAVRYAIRRGVTQFLDIGTGIPTAGNVHEVAHELAPEARVAYVDHDPIVLTHARALLSREQQDRVTIVPADLREPEKILAASEIRDVLDFDRPVALMLVSVLHFLRDDEDPYGVVKRLCDGLAPGSMLMLTHASLDPDPETGLAASAGWANATSTMNMRTHEEILRFFDGLELVEPGLTVTWNPDGEPTEVLERAIRNVWGYGGVAVKPPAGAHPDH